ncbi:MAG: CPXCG motif-containing cysteine-rich protein [Gomphosphaeria aponina SAG 52.96 = DSM 107014]|uniref:CPXCG motif-containing cysteine-rich protein n=1 Tax=Gomphosphaeria aponina SAG 52.96 = DSM 107014 TaxID=1521640 RepID=A0A941GQ83_9CHRO|nr:CPXCG motif-containing cysteine-rich protein [Gomphosphaeria aponina SAG 52.96 = DSM 107014]
METTAEYMCAFCGETNVTFVDLSAGMEQSYIEDCQVCCRPNKLYLRVDEATLDVEIESDYES